MASKTVNGLFWSSMERLSVQGAQFVLSLFIARILSPSDYGLVAMLGIFMAVAQTFVDSGFSNALIQKQGRTDVDYSTVFFFQYIYRDSHVPSPFLHRSIHSLILQPASTRNHHKIRRIKLNLDLILRRTTSTTDHFPRFQKSKLSSHSAQ